MGTPAFANKNFVRGVFNMENNSLKDNLKVCICGGGNAAHAMIGLFSSRNIYVNVYSPFEDTAERMIEGLQKNNGIKVSLPDNETVFGRLVKISDRAEDVIPDCNFIILPVPSLAYESILTDIKPFLRSGAVIGATPGLGGFDLSAWKILDRKLTDYVIFGLSPLPWNCRIISYGEEVMVKVEKKNLVIAVNSSIADVKENIRQIVSDLFKADVKLMDHFLAITLFPANPVIHPARLYGLFRDYHDGQIYRDNPFFYEDMDDFSAECIQKVSDELQNICKSIEEKSSVRLLRDVLPIIELTKRIYPDEIEDLSSLKQILRTNTGYKSFRTPMKKIESGWIPDFSNRYFTEDIPFGLCIYKGIAEILVLETRMIDTIMNWAQKHVNKEYLVNGKLQGKDVPETNAPQRFGINNLEDLIDISRL